MNIIIKEDFLLRLFLSFVVFNFLGCVISNRSDTGVVYQTGRASWYGDKFHGRKTASGEIYNMNAMSAAHRKLPFGTKVKVMSKTTGKSVIVTINDRGPFAKKRIIDLSKAAAKELGMINLGEILVTLVVL